MQRGESFTDPQASGRFFQDKLAGLEQEVFAAAFLDTRHRLIEYVELFQGTIDGAEVHPREVVRAALRLNAAAVLVAHNHPSGEVEPSAADRVVTLRLKQALALVVAPAGPRHRRWTAEHEHGGERVALSRFRA